MEQLHLKTEQASVLENGAAPVKNGRSIFKLEDGAALFKNGASLKMEPTPLGTEGELRVTSDLVHLHV